ncbi:MAG TPA: hypothetical protein DCG19_00250 [Cryomorphaceae bacterium]|nr:hypothetical protein [Cryomorphaceae bacterium]
MNTMKMIELKLKSRFFRLMGIALLAPVLFLSSCNKDDDDDTQEQTISEEEAAEVVIASVSAETAGTVGQVEEASLLITAEIDEDDCNQTVTGSITGSNPPGTVMEYTYDYNRSYTLSCDGSNEPQSLTYAFTGTSGYNAPRMASDDHVSSEASVTGLGSSSVNLTFNQSYGRNGSQQSKIRNKQAFTSKVSVQTNNLVVNKLTKKVESGNATVNISGKSSNGSNFAYTGTIVFNGNGQATLNIQGGGTYVINL